MTPAREVNDTPCDLGTNPTTTTNIHNHNDVGHGNYFASADATTNAMNVPNDIVASTKAIHRAEVDYTQYVIPGSTTLSTAVMYMCKMSVGVGEKNKIRNLKSCTSKSKISFAILSNFTFSSSKSLILY